ncbi:MAG: hypothetical protein A2176_00465 [Spirochaetes bacterium RBG_13_51_14]|nr:MAG: hypothetical protein A2176_00465 [Spirochaetes bacterium RBG_13_51_14]
MKKLRIATQVNKIEQEIIKKERLARDAKKKGMLTVYSNYVMDISVLKTDLQKLATSPFRQMNL